MDRHPICGKMDTQKQLNVPLHSEIRNEFPHYTLTPLIGATTPGIHLASYGYSDESLNVPPVCGVHVARNDEPIALWGFQEFSDRMKQLADLVESETPCVSIEMDPFYIPPRSEHDDAMNSDELFMGALSKGKKKKQDIDLRCRKLE